MIPIIHIFILTCLNFISFSNAQNKGIVQSYSKEEFLSQLDKSHNFVMFFAPWCSHCKRLDPVWEDLAQEINSKNNNVVIAKVDCTIHSELCSVQDITGYPTLKLFKLGESEGKKFKGIRDIPTLKRFLNEELLGENEMFEISKDPDAQVLVELNDDNFEDNVSKGSYFVKFFAPWCSHCQELAPTWHDLAKALIDDKDVTIAKLDCTKSIKVCSIYEVMSYPTLLWMQDGKKIDVYQGDRTLENLVEYVSQMMQPAVPKLTEDVDNDFLDIPEKSVIALNGENFQVHTDNGFTFVKFFAPWCGHCKRLAPTWEELAQKLPEFKIAHVDCTLEENKELCNEQEVEGYPTLFLYRNGAKISEYSGPRGLEDLIEFLKRHSTHDEL